MYRISVTTVEKFRRYMTSASSFDTEESLIESIRGLFYGNDKTKFGTAFGKIIESPASYFKTPEADLPAGFLVDNIFFSESLAECALRFREKHPTMIFEVPVFKEYTIGNIKVLLSGRTDGIEGVNVHDTKTKFRAPDFQEYIDSYQWRFYLDMLDLKTFFYDIFEVKGFESLAPAGVTILPRPDVQIIPYEPLYCCAYDGMSDDIQSLLYHFFQYIEQRNLFKYLKTA